MAKIEAVLAQVGELLAALTVELQSASIEEMPALIDGAKGSGAPRYHALFGV